LSDTVASGTPSRPLLFILSRDGGGRAHHPSSSVFCGLPRIRPLRFLRSRRFRDPAGSSGFPRYFSGSRPLSDFQGFPPDFVVAPTFDEVWLSPKVWLSSKVWLSPVVWLSPKVCPSPKVWLSPPQGLSVTQGLSIARPRSVHHLTPLYVCHPTSVCPSPDPQGLSVARPKVCLSPDLGLSVTRPLGLSVTRPRSVRLPTQGLSVARPRSVRHLTSCLDGFAHDPSQSPSLAHGPGRPYGRSRPPSFQSGGWGLLSCLSVGGWPFSVPGGSAGLAPPWLSRSHWIYL
jgi:hypothetical protein